MKHPLIQLPVDKVTISAQGRTAADRLRAGDKPFVTFLKESEKADDQIRGTLPETDYNTVGAASPIEDGDNREWFAPPVARSSCGFTGDKLTFDVGSRLEFKAPSNLGAIVIRSTTKLNLSDGPYSCETNWEVFPDEVE